MHFPNVSIFFEINCHNKERKIFYLEKKKEKKIFF